MEQSDGESIEVKPYLTTLCEAIALSMIDNGQHISIKVSGNEGNAICRDAESLGLIVRTRHKFYQACVQQ